MHNIWLHYHFTCAIVYKSMITVPLDFRKKDVEQLFRIKLQLCKLVIWKACGIIWCITEQWRYVFAQHGLPIVVLWDSGLLYRLFKFEQFMFLCNRHFIFGTHQHNTNAQEIGHPVQFGRKEVQTGDLSQHKLQGEEVWCAQQILWIDRVVLWTWFIR